MPYYNIIIIVLEFDLTSSSVCNPSREYPCICSKIFKSLNLCRSLPWRFACMKRWNSSYSELLNSSGITKLSDHRKFLCLTYFYKAINGQLTLPDHYSPCEHSQHWFQQQGYIIMFSLSLTPTLTTTLSLPPPYQSGTHSHTQLLPAPSVQSFKYCLSKLL